MKPNDPLVSILLPVYNREASVREAIQSVVSQAYRHWELLVIDDGSMDGTVEAVRAFGSSVRLIQQAHAGAYAARNRGLQEAQGEFIAFIDSDDRWLAQKLEHQLPLFTNPGVGLVYGNALLVDCNENRWRPLSYSVFQLYPPTRRGVFRRLMKYNFIPQSSVIVRSACFKKVGPFSLAGPLGADYVKWAQISLSYDLDYIDEPVFELGVHADSESRANVARSLTSQYHLLTKLEPQVESPQDRFALQHRLFDLHVNYALYQKLGRFDAGLPRSLGEAKNLSIGRRIFWTLQFFYHKTILFFKLRMLYRKI